LGIPKDTKLLDTLAHPGALRNKEALEIAIELLTFRPNAALQCQSNGTGGDGVIGYASANANPSHLILPHSPDINESRRHADTPVGCGDGPRAVCSSVRRPRLRRSQRFDADIARS
jgi:hypothetical protein